MEHLLAMSYIGEICNYQLNSVIADLICPVYFSKNWTNFEWLVLIIMKKSKELLACKFFYKKLIFELYNL